ncbi:polysaccharide deacetylase family protein, partial [Flavobacterium oreochromis]
MINKNIKFKILKFKNRIFKGRPVLVLVYHRINDVVDFQNAGLTVSVSDFEKQLIYFKENFEILKLGDDWKKIKKNALVITFDDGYADNYLNALPLLEKYQIPATIFICSYNINSNEEFWWDRLANLYNQLPKKFINLKGKTVDKSQWSYKVLEKSVRDKNVFKIVENC